MPSDRPLSPAEAEALDELFHQLDLIGARPLPCEIAWALERARGAAAP